MEVYWMICGQGFDEKNGIMWMTINATVMIIGCLGLYGLSLLDNIAKGEPKYRKVSCRHVAVICMVNSILICILAEMWGKTDDGVFQILLSLVAACLLVASVMDIETHMIYNYVWWIGGIVTGALLFISGNWEHARLGLLGYVLIQELVFSRMYGRADCHAFVICAVALCAMGGTMKEYLLHMLISFILLSSVAVIHKNVGRDGNLKEAVPFLPYITTGFWLFFLLWKL